jgi:replicative DNA helicase
LDDNFAIIKRATFTILAAKRGSGKTTFAFDMACKNALLGHKVLFVSLEMEKHLIKEDFARRRAGITIPEERDYKIPEMKQLAFEEKIKEIDSIENLYFSGVQRGSDISWDGIKILISEYKDLDLIIIDNLDLIDKNEGEEENDKQKRIMKNIMNYTTDQQVPLILIHHYRKTQGASKGHGMDELSGSGKIADSADIVIRISRSSNPDAVYPEKYMSNIWLQKARGYNESYQDVFFLGGTFVDDAPKELNPAMDELNKEFPDESRVEPLIVKPYNDDVEDNGHPF